MLAVPQSKCIKLSSVPDASSPDGSSKLSTSDHYLNEKNVHKERDDAEVNNQPADNMLALLAKVAREVDRQPLKPLRNILKNPLDTARSRTLQLRTEGPSNSPGVFVNICTRLCLHATFNKPDPCALCPTFQAQSYSEKFPVIYNDF